MPETPETPATVSIDGEPGIDITDFTISWVSDDPAMQADDSGWTTAAPTVREVINHAWNTSWQGIASRSERATDYADAAAAVARERCYRCWGAGYINHLDGAMTPSENIWAIATCDCDQFDNHLAAGLAALEAGGADRLVWLDTERGFTVLDYGFQPHDGAATEKYVYLVRHHDTPLHRVRAYLEGRTLPMRLSIATPCDSTNVWIAVNGTTRIGVISDGDTHSGDPLLVLVDEDESVIRSIPLGPWIIGETEEPT